jgi:hypothetical protein
MTTEPTLEFKAALQARLSRIFANRAVTIALEAGAARSQDQAELFSREVTGEDLLQLTERAGGSVTHIVRDENGLITEIEASIHTPDLCEYDPAECQEVLESLEATGVAPTRMTGDLAQTSISTPYAVTATTTSASPTITLSAANASLTGTCDITGPGIPAGTTVTFSGTTGTLSAAATATGTAVALSVTTETQVLGLGDWAISWKRKTVETTTTDAAVYETSLPSTASWSVKAKYMYIDGDASQALTLTSALSTPAGSQLWNFFPTIAVGRAAWQGQAFIDGIDLGAGVGKMVGLDVSLKGTGPLNQVTQIAPAVTTSTLTGLQAEV